MNNLTPPKLFIFVIAAFCSQLINLSPASAGGSMAGGGGNTVGDVLFDDYETSGDIQISPAEIKLLVTPIFQQLDQKIVGLSSYLSKGMTDIKWYKETKPLDQNGFCRNGAQSGLNPVINATVRACQNQYMVKIDADWYTRTQLANPSLLASLMVHELLVYRALRTPIVSQVTLQSDGTVQDTFHGVRDPLTAATEGTISTPRSIGQYDEEAVLLISRELRDNTVSQKQLQSDLIKTGFGHFYTMEEESVALAKLNLLLEKTQHSVSSIPKLNSAIVNVCNYRKAQLIESPHRNCGLTVVPGPGCQAVFEKRTSVLQDLYSFSDEFELDQFPVIQQDPKLSAMKDQILSLKNKIEVIRGRNDSGDVFADFQSNMWCFGNDRRRAEIYAKCQLTNVGEDCRTAE